MHVPARSRRWAIHALTMLTVITFAIPTHAERFVIAAGDESRVQFESHAPLESFTGKTTAVSGVIECDPAALGDSITVVVEVDMASLDTGIGKRNADMRENHLETDRHPTATFRGASLLGEPPSSLAAGQPTDVRMAGTLTLHGVSRRIEVLVTLTLAADASTLRAVTAFPVRLDDYSISRPKFLFLKLGEVQDASLDVVATAER